MTIRVFVGCAANNEDLESMAVLEYSITRFASEPVDFCWMKLSRDPESPFYSNQEGGGWQTEKWATPFSAFRWAIPSLCHFEGKAIYTDSDVIFMDDIGQLWDQELEPGKVVLAKGGLSSWRYCVSLWDCAAVKPYAKSLWALQADPDSHAKMTKLFMNNYAVVQPFVGNWNCLDGENYADLHDPEIKAIHYTDMSKQPQLKYAIPRLEAEGKKHWYDGQLRENRADLVALFDEFYAEAVRMGYTTNDYVSEPFGEYKKRSLQNYQGSRK